MDSFKGMTRENRPVVESWLNVYRACCQHEKFIIEVRKYDETVEITLKQFLMVQ